MDADDALSGAQAGCAREVRSEPSDAWRFDRRLAPAPPNCRSDELGTLSPWQPRGEGDHPPRGETLRGRGNANKAARAAARPRREAVLRDGARRRTAPSSGRG